MHHNKDMVSSQKPNLGQLLLDFLEFFGEKFDYENYGEPIFYAGFQRQNEMKAAILEADPQHENT